MTSKHLYCILLILFFVSCEQFKYGKTENCSQEDYDECLTYKPPYGSVWIDISPADYSEGVIIEIFEGKIEEGIVVYSDTLFQESQEYFFDSERYYSAIAYYTEQAPPIKAIDGGELKLIQYKMCELRCYLVEDLILDLRLE